MNSVVPLLKYCLVSHCNSDGQFTWVSGACCEERVYKNFIFELDRISFSPAALAAKPYGHLDWQSRDGQWQRLYLIFEPSANRYDGVVKMEQQDGLMHSDMIVLVDELRFNHTHQKTWLA